MRRLVAAALAMFACTLAGCGGEPNSLFDSAGYHLRGDTVYYLNAFPGKAFEIAGADAATFEVLDRTYARDRRTVYVDGRPLAGADSESFVLLDRPGYARDAGQVFVRDRVLSTDPGHFELLAGGLSKDSSAVYWTDGSVLSTDPVHFAVVSDADNYLFTKDSVGVHVNGNPVADADPVSFRVLDGAYATDRGHAYYFDGVIDGADVASLRYVAGPYAVDARRVYWMGMPIPDAAAESFRVLNAAFECSADATHAYYRDIPIKGSDPRTFPANRQVVGCSEAEVSFAP